MRKIFTEIEINASAADVWSRLLDFDQYPEWNPFLISIIGKPILGETLKVSIDSGGKISRFNPKVVQVENKRRFAWKGKLLFGFLFSGHHYFEIKEKSENVVVFEHGENFTGIFSGPILNKIGESTKKGFIEMNEAFKALVEQQ